MPTYDFKCLKCGHLFEKLLPLGAKSPKCDCCGHKKTQKLLSAPAVHFKGSGFYSTDSRLQSTATKTSVKTESSKNTEKKNDLKNDNTKNIPKKDQKPKKQKDMK